MKRLFRQKEYSLIFFTGLFVAIILISNIASTKIAAAGSIVFDAGTILFPISYVIGSIITELYGLKKADFIIYTGLAAQLLASLTFIIVGLLPAQADWANQGAYEAILGIIPRIAIASIIAYVIGELSNVRILSYLKKHIKHRSLRIAISMAIAQLVDTVIFSTIAFSGTMPTSVLVTLTVTVLGIKYAVILLLSPISSRIVSTIGRLSEAK